MQGKIRVDELSLKDIIFSGDISYDDFMENYYHKKPCILTRKNKYIADIYSPSNVDNVLSEINVCNENFWNEIGIYNFDKSDENVITKKTDNGDDLLLNYEIRNILKGKTRLELFDASYYDNDLKKLKNNFEYLLQEKVSVAAFYSFSSDQMKMTQEHYDLSDLFILQTDGCKNWKIREPIVHNPIIEIHENIRSGETYQKELSKTKNEYIMDITLNEGDVLYLPRGFPHLVSYDERESLHLVIDVVCHNLLRFKQYNIKKNVEQNMINPLSWGDLSHISEKQILENINDNIVLENKDIADYIIKIHNKKHSSFSKNFIPNLSIPEKTLENHCKINYFPVYEHKCIHENASIFFLVNQEKIKIKDCEKNNYEIIINFLFKERECDIEKIIKLFGPEDKENILSILLRIYKYGLIDIIILKEDVKFEKPYISQKLNFEIDYKGSFITNLDNNYPLLDNNDVNNILSGINYIISPENFDFICADNTIAKDISSHDNIYEYSSELLNKPNNTLKPHKVRQFFLKNGILKISKSQNMNLKIKRIVSDFEYLTQSECVADLNYNHKGNIVWDNGSSNKDLFVIQCKGSCEWIVNNKDNKAEKYNLINGSVLFIPKGSDSSWNIGDKGSLNLFVFVNRKEILDFKIWQAKLGNLSAINSESFNVNKSTSENLRLSNELLDRDINDYKVYIEKTSYSNSSTGFIPSEIIRIEKKSDFTIYYCPIFRSILEKTDEDFILFANGEKFNMDSDDAIIFKNILDVIFNNKILTYKKLIKNKYIKKLDKGKIIDVLNDLRDNGIVNIMD